MKPLRDYLRRYLDRPMVRPLALAGPVLVLLIALPMLRPLRHPGTPSNDETLRLASIQALVEHGSLLLGHGYAKVPGAVVLPTGTYAAQPPMMAVLLSAPAWMMTRMGYTFADNQLLIAYFLTVLGVTLPVAGAAGLIYRMGRLFELRRPWRTAMSFAVVAGSGLLSYSVVLNPYAPAATLIIGSAACLIHVAAMHRDERRAGWFALAGACTALATTLDPAAGVLLILFLCVIPAMRFSRSRRAVGMFVYILGAIPVISLHCAWNIPVTGTVIPASLQYATAPKAASVAVATTTDEFADDVPLAQTMWDRLGANVAWFAGAVIGSHGLLSHFPVVILGILGIAAVMHRHWPGSTKTLAAASGVAAIIIPILYRIGRADWDDAMFASQWFVVFTPCLLFWGGAWLRRKHAPIVWGLAGLLLLFSMAVGFAGAMDPTPRNGFDGYTALRVLNPLSHEQPTTERSTLVNRAR